MIANSALIQGTGFTLSTDSGMNVGTGCTLGNIGGMMTCE